MQSYVLVKNKGVWGGIALSKHWHSVLLIPATHNNTAVNLLGVLAILGVLAGIFNTGLRSVLLNIGHCVN